MSLHAKDLTATLSGAKNVNDYGSNTTPGTTDMTTAFASAITAAGAGGCVYIPPGSYKLTAPLNPLQGQRIIGGGCKNTLLMPTAMSAGAVFTFDPGAQSAYFIKNELAHFQVLPASAGSMTDVIKVIPNATWGGLWEFHFHDLLIDTTSGVPSNSDILLENVVQGTMDNISFRGNCTDAHIELASADATHSQGVYALNIRNVYSTANTATPYGIKAVGTHAAHTALQIDKATLQNHTTAGIYLAFTQNVDVNQYYSEDNVRALIAGNYGSVLFAKGLNINGGRVWSTNAAHKGFLLDAAEHVNIIGPFMQELTNDNWIEYGRISGVVVQMTGQTGDAVHDRIKYNANAVASSGLTIIGAGNRDGSFLITEAPSITMLDTTLGASSARRHWKMTLDGTGTWVATQWNPVAA